MLWYSIFFCCLFIVNGQVREEIHPAPEPYSFGYSAVNDDGVTGNARQETGDASGRVTGFYTLIGEDGQQRRVDYVADQDGFRATVTTNEVGTETRNPNPANAEILSSAPTAGELTARWEAQNAGVKRVSQGRINGLHTGVGNGLFVRPQVVQPHIGGQVAVVQRPAVVPTPHVGGQVAVVQRPAVVERPAVLQRPPPLQRPPVTTFNTASRVGVVGVQPVTSRVVGTSGVNAVPVRVETIPPSPLVNEGALTGVRVVSPGAVHTGGLVYGGVPYGGLSHAVGPVPYGGLSHAVGPVPYGGLSHAVGGVVPLGVNYQSVDLVHDNRVAPIAPVAPAVPVPVGNYGYRTSALRNVVVPHATEDVKLASTGTNVLIHPSVGASQVKYVDY